MSWGELYFIVDWDGDRWKVKAECKKEHGQREQYRKYKQFYLDNNVRP